ncbi:MAG: alpha/beta fold hydrolase, partial [Cyanobacteria bacterium REEB65]|nr:alpha/beta fold hydrolase [Cyanobacteria bacterium REEB65]
MIAQPPPHAPVVLVAGLDDTAAKMGAIDRYLLSKGWSEILAVTLTPSNGSVGQDVLATQLQGAALAFRTQTHADHLDLVAFSMGGIVSRYYLQRLGGAQYVRHFVSISSPNHGSDDAYLGSGVGIAQLRPDSPFMA